MTPTHRLEVYREIDRMSKRTYPKCHRILAEDNYCGECFHQCRTCGSIISKDIFYCKECMAKPQIQPSEHRVKVSDEDFEKMSERMGALNGKDKGLKFDADKLRLDLLPTEALEELSKVYAFGAKKYAAHNWRKGMLWSRLFGACLRHLFAWWRGEDKDSESGLSHLIHASFCVLTLLDFERSHPEKDDRPHKVCEQ